MKNILLITGALLIIIVGGYYFFSNDEAETYTKPTTPEVVETTNETPLTVPETIVTEDVEETQTNEPTSIIGESVKENNIVAYHFGEGEKEILFIGGIHGGYSWNTALLGFELVDWLTENENLIPKNLKVTVIPVLNPDGLLKVTGSTDRFVAADASTVQSVKVSGRFNAHEVDLNRNFDCEWKPTGTWQNQSVSGGSSAFSEPESQAIRSYVNENKPSAVVTWYSAAGGVYSSSCGNGPSTETIALTNIFAKASGYTAYEEFDYYEITGDMVNWFAKEGIPAISVLLTNHTETEFSKNRAGIEAVLNYYAE